MLSPRTISSLYTDGACTGNPGPGGWGVVVYFADGSVYEMGGAEAQTTNNRMEMIAAIAALKLLATSGQSEPVTLYTDSEYLKKGITQWVKSWKKKGCLKTESMEKYEFVNQLFFANFIFFPTLFFCDPI